MRKSGIYVIECRANGKKYVGSSINMNKRWRNHVWHLTRGTHHNRHLQSAWSKYGRDQFTHSVLEIVEDPSVLLERERYHIQHLDAYCSGYNLVAHPEHNLLGFKHSDETREKMSRKAKERGRVTDHMTEEQVDEMRRRFFNGERISFLAEHFDIHRRTVREIVHLRRYKDYQVKIDGYEEMINQKENDYKNGKRPRSRGWKQTQEFKEKLKRAVSKPRLATRKFTEEQVRLIRERKKSESYAKIAKDYKVSIGTIVKIIKRETYSDVN